ncbi:autophagy protein Apg5-domain-containing protein [Echria macrotheca]|uniref:Autophagy protein 5 n=1 Tax=Echria macrotheca TaxID=438768 RepID=A0AAJ0F204_9PEZI|nr:autophagy protein Apg5-domain-containing protein [Echria macrotheca]
MASPSGGPGPSGSRSPRSPGWPTPTPGDAQSPAPAASLPQTLWTLSIPVLITHASLPASQTPFITSVPRFSYLALLLPRLHTFFGQPCSSFHHEEVQLRNLAVGLLADLYQPALPWRLVVGDGPEWDIADTFMNSAKEADFVRNGNAKQIMGLSKEHTTALWNAVRDGDYAVFAKVQTQLLNPPTPFKNVPIRIYMPSSPETTSNAQTSQTAGSFKVVQRLVPPRLPNRTHQTLGTALKSLLPSLFPSSRDPVLATVLLHGAPVPFRAPIEELMREAAYPDGWLCFIVVVL